MSEALASQEAAGAASVAVAAGKGTRAHYESLAEYAGPFAHDEPLAKGFFAAYRVHDVLLREAAEQCGALRRVLGRLAALLFAATVKSFVGAGDGGAKAAAGAADAPMPGSGVQGGAGGSGALAAAPTPALPDRPAGRAPPIFTCCGDEGAEEVEVRWAVWTEASVVLASFVIRVDEAGTLHVGEDGEDGVYAEAEWAQAPPVEDRATQVAKGIREVRLAAARMEVPPLLDQQHAAVAQLLRGDEPLRMPVDSLQEVVVRESPAAAVSEFRGELAALDAALEEGWDDGHGRPSPVTVAAFERLAEACAAAGVTIASPAVAGAAIRFVVPRPGGAPRAVVQGQSVWLWDSSAYDLRLDTGLAVSALATAQREDGRVVLPASIIRSTSVVATSAS